MSNRKEQLLAELRAVIEADIRAALLENPNLTREEISQVMESSVESLYRPDGNLRKKLL